MLLHSEKTLIGLFRPQVYKKRALSDFSFNGVELLDILYYDNSGIKCQDPIIRIGETFVSDILSV